MPLTMSVVLKSASGQMLGALGNCLRKGQEHARAHNIADEVFLGLRLFPDMFPLSRQVQIACDQVTRGAARLSGVDLPSFPDVETNFDELIARVAKANAWCQAADSAAMDARADLNVTLPVGGGAEMTMTCQALLLGFVLPNLYFHSATAYDILRHNGVALGKRDFLTA